LPTFYCHLRSARAFLPDRDGFDCPDLQAATGCARAAARELAGSFRYSRFDLLTWAFEIESRDEPARVVIPFRVSDSPRLRRRHGPAGSAGSLQGGPQPRATEPPPVFDLSASAADLASSLLDLCLEGPRLMALIVDFAFLPPRSALTVRADSALLGHLAAR
jgi:hypothetical protein